MEVAETDSIGADAGHPQLRRKINIIDVVALGVGATVGVSIFSIMAPAAKVAGPGMLLSLVLAAIPMAIFAVLYGFMGSTVPTSGASYAWPTQFVHPYVGFMIAWLRIVANTGYLALLTLVLIQYLSKAFVLPQKPTMALVLVIFYIANLVGIKSAANAERALVLLKVLALAVFVCIGIAAIHPTNFHPVLEKGWSGIFYALPLLVGLYLGIETATEVGEEIENGAAVISRGIWLSALVSMLIYVAVSVVVVGVLGAGHTGASEAPLVDAGAHFLGSFNMPLILITATAAIGTAINATFLTFSRFLFAMGRDGVLPSALGKVHPRWGTPHVAITVSFLCGLLGLLLPSSLIFLFLAVNIPTILKYVANCFSATGLVKHYPELHARAKLKMSSRSVKTWAYLGAACGVVIIVAGYEADWRPYAILVVWGVIGTIYWFIRGKHSRGAMELIQ